MERCERYTQLLSARMDGELAPQERQELENHLAICPECRALAEQLEALRACMQDMEDVPAPQDFARGVMDRIRGQEQKPKVIPLFRRPQIRALAGLAACALLCIGLYRTGMFSGGADGLLTADAGVSMQAPDLSQEESSADGASAPGIAAFGTDGSPSERSAGLEAYDAGPGEDGAGSTQDTGGSVQAGETEVHSPTVEKEIVTSSGETGNSGDNPEEPGVNSVSATSSGTQSQEPEPAADPLEGYACVLTLSALPEGADTVLGAEAAWSTDEQERMLCTVSLEQLEALERLAQEQGLAASRSSGGTENGVYAVVLLQE